jgi:hypothetical protein
MSRKHCSVFDTHWWRLVNYVKSLIKRDKYRQRKPLQWTLLPPNFRMCGFQRVINMFPASNKINKYMYVCMYVISRDELGHGQGANNS